MASGMKKPPEGGLFNYQYYLAFFGSPGQARTADLVINSHPLYRLSYRGIALREKPE